jgi:hypothetical protein
MDAKYKRKRLGEFIGTERDKILSGVHLLSVHEVYIVEEMWLDVL